MKNVIAVKKIHFYILYQEVIIFHFQRKEKGIYSKIKINFPFEDLVLNPYSYNRVNKNYDLIWIINKDNYNEYYNCFCKNYIN